MNLTDSIRLMYTLNYKLWEVKLILHNELERYIDDTWIDCENSTDLTLLRESKKPKLHMCSSDIRYK